MIFALFNAMMGKHTLNRVDAELPLFNETCAGIGGAVDILCISIYQLAFSATSDNEAFLSPLKICWPDRH